MPRAAGFAFARSCGWSVIAGRDCLCGDLALARLAPDVASNAFLRFWRDHKLDRADAVAVVWPENPPARYRGLFAVLATKPNVRSVPPSALKALCGGAACTVGDVLREAQSRHPLSGATSFERAFAVLAAGLAADSLAGVGGEESVTVDAAG